MGEYCKTVLLVLGVYYLIMANKLFPGKLRMARRWIGAKIGGGGKEGAGTGRGKNGDSSTEQVPGGEATVSEADGGGSER